MLDTLLSIAVTLVAPTAETTTSPTDAPPTATPSPEVTPETADLGETGETPDEAAEPTEVVEPPSGTEPEATAVTEAEVTTGSEPVSAAVKVDSTSATVATERQADPVEVSGENGEAEAAEPAKPAKQGPKFSPGVQVFLRGQGRLDPDFGTTGTSPDTAEILERARIQLLATWGPVRAFVQAQDSRVWGFEASTISNEGNVDLHQGYMDLFGESSKRPLSGFARVGRQEITWGSQRMIGNLAWLPGARSFDAARVQGQAGKVEADGFAAVLAPRGVVSDDSFDPPARASTDGSQLFGGRVAYHAHEAVAAELISLAVREDAKNGALAFDRRVVDVGGRVWGEPVTGATYDVEAHGQVGRFNGLDHRAWAWAATARYLHPRWRAKPGGHIGYAMASGSACSQAPDATRANCAPSQSNDFFNFYPTNHIHYGLVDLLGWVNMRDLELGLDLEFEWLSATAAYHWFQLQEPDGSWRNAGGAPVGAAWDPSNSDRTLGHELDVFAALQPWKPLKIMPGYGVFIPDGAGRSLGGTAPQHFLYLWLVATFEAP